MKRIGWLLVLLLFPGLIASVNAQPIDNDEILKSLAADFIENLNRGNYTEATAGFDSTMNTAINVEQLQQLWESLQGQFGAYQGPGGTQADKYEQYDIIFVTMCFEKMKLDAKLVFNQARQISGLFFVPTPPTEPYKPPAYADTGAFTETDIVINEGSDWALPGTLTVPVGEGQFPAVVLVHGSGPNDRDETIGPNKPFKDIAWGLASKGIAVLRYDKRTKVHAMKFAEVKKITVYEETVADAVAAVELLDVAGKIDKNKIFVLGHSLGGLCLPRIGERSDKIAGLIMLAGSSRPLVDIILEQYEYIFGLDSVISDEEQKEIDKLKMQIAVSKSDNFSENTLSDSTPMGAPAAYWLDLKNYDPVKTAQTLKIPMLILQGERDYQVTMVDFEGWQVGLKDRDNVAFKSYPNLNHLFIDGKGKAVPDEYMIPGQVDGDVIKDISVWILSH
ncbi:MAG: DUF3887 domain-containing protein [Candidatus Zixiibacteriota bacterium]